MSRIVEIRRRVEDYRSAELITSALEIISASKMQELRQEFQGNAEFFAGISEVYGIVRGHILASEQKRNEADNEPVGRDLYIAITSNKRFYGTLNRDIVRSFVSVLEKVENGDFLMIGQTGHQYLEEMSVQKPVQRMEFIDESPNAEELQRVLDLHRDHTRVFVVYPKFVNPFRQDVVMTDIAQSLVTDVIPDSAADYIFEPEISGMVEFFEHQVRRAIFGRVMLEAELARSAARTMKMHSARDRANSLKETNELNLHHEYAVLADIERMASFISFNSWKV